MIRNGKYREHLPFQTPLPNNHGQNSMSPGCIQLSYPDEAYSIHSQWICLLQLPAPAMPDLQNEAIDFAEHFFSAKPNKQEQILSKKIIV